MLYIIVQALIEITYERILEFLCPFWQPLTCSCVGVVWVWGGGRDRTIPPSVVMLLVQPPLLILHWLSGLVPSHLSNWYIMYVPTPFFYSPLLRCRALPNMPVSSANHVCSWAWQVILVLELNPTECSASTAAQSYDIIWAALHMTALQFAAAGHRLYYYLNHH